MPELTQIACESMGSMGALPDAAPESSSEASMPGSAQTSADVTLYTLRNAALTLRVASYGARVVALETPDRSGARRNVVLGYAELAPYRTGRNFYYGATVGRVANRIAGGRFRLDGKTYSVPTNNGPNALHGGPQGFDTRNWESHADETGVTFSRISPDGEQGFPGTVHASVRYTLEGATVRIEMRATTDATTIVNLANHSYFQLAGEGAPSVLDHQLTLHADAFTPVDEHRIPTGELRPVHGTPFDFRAPHRLGERIEAKDRQLRYGSGYDHNFVVRGEPGTLRPVATVFEPGTGRVLAVASTTPGVQFYSGNFLDGAVPGYSGRPYLRRSGFCLETQGFPDAVNHADFPSTVLHPGETYTSTTLWSFSAR